MRRISSWWLVILALLALPALAQAAPPTPACGAAAFLSSLNGAASAGTYQPLAAQLAVRSSVSGPGDRRVERARSPIAKDYLPDCNDCTESTPCDTECGYDPGKGGPVTCGEWGRCATTCYSSTTLSEHWSSWYVTGSYNAGTYACYVSDAFGDSTSFQLHVTQYRRDRIRTTLICPNAPPC